MYINVLDNYHEEPLRGLAVCQQIVSKHGGTIKVESRLGETATFRVTLPLSVLDGLVREVQIGSP